MCLVGVMVAVIVRMHFTVQYKRIMHMQLVKNLVVGQRGSDENV